MKLESKIYVAGHAGLVGSAIVRNLQSKWFTNIVGKRSAELDLTRQADVEAFFAAEQPEYVFLAAAKVGGINANNTYPAEFIYINSVIQTNVIHAAYLNDVKKLMFLGSGCIYPKIVSQPIKEEYLLTAELEKTNEAYAIAKIAGLKMCEFYNRQYGTDYISCMPANLYGTGDNFNLENSHVVPALIRKVCEAKERNEPTVTMWGTGSAYREFLHVDDMADACVFLMENYSGNEHVNIGIGNDITIKELIKLIAKIAGFKGEIITDPSKPDGTPRKLLDSSKLFAMGWKPKIDLEDGLRSTYEDYLKNRDTYRK
jgi:GDP-L-fucose synthase